MKGLGIEGRKGKVKKKKKREEEKGRRKGKKKREVKDDFQILDGK